MSKEVDPYKTAVNALRSVQSSGRSEAVAGMEITDSVGSCKESSRVVA